MDRAVAVFGTHADSDIEKSQEGKKGRAAEAAANGALMRWLDDGRSDKPQRKGMFRQPAATTR